MSSAGERTQVVDVSYDDHRTGERVWERKVQQVPYDEIEEIRGQELALFRPSNARPRAERRDERDYRDGRAYDDFYASRPRPRDRLAPPIDERYDDRYARRGADRQVARRRDDQRDRRRKDDYSDSDSESSRERRHRRRHRRAKSEQPSKDREQENNNNEDDGGVLWYSGKPRNQGNFRERHFDSSYDGIIAAVAGAAIGGITARSFGGDEKKGWKIAGGALVGAAAFNSAENHYRVYTEEREEKEQERERQGKPRKKDPNEEGQFAGPLELGGEALQVI